MRIHALKILLLGLCCLSGCNAPIPLAVGAASGIYYTRTKDLPPADNSESIPPHESWCYSTISDEVECFTQPQDTIPTRLIMVEPASRYPMSVKAYREAVVQSQLAQAPKLSMKPVEGEPLLSPPVQTSPMKPIPLVEKLKTHVAPKATTQPKAETVKKKKAPVKPAKPAAKKLAKPVEPCPCPDKKAEPKLELKPEPLNGIEP